MPHSFKEAMVRPKLKKNSSDFDVFPHFRPISNLKLLPKIIEKAVARQLIDYLKTNGIEEPLQSAYKVFQSTETALVRVQNDILCAIDRQQSVILLLLHLSAAFDTVDHDLLISRLHTRFGIKGNALRWFVSYLQDRKRFVQVNDARSMSKDLHRGVP